ncbi:hypothetical protein [Stenotrophomonas sp. SORGH_AS_0282]|uniref:hypothetical protein n=1 Tax=Stenotrophomonas sp. SORGH_AS_0282 TaxID=3041763 RepID=UPI00277EDA4B|nr:hypothetical protein [Stenotrophomonas sp. SORGH_AS_0282]MDQ1064067.1 type IV secretory pathway ATPase VirB11/archaellum biosynthesis ATPase [Stenotrophomonas sp. SORGH_AS_0282]MDQ1187562.1 type IV secretory pathway ATPase VirB11/archaellum biosynthesis ATPase [Stenotrophomonas sp. SORGH_AS_0282]
MSTGTRKIKSDLRDFAGEVMRELQSRQTVQSFNGALRVNPDRVVISEVEGRRAIEKLRQRLK